MIKTVVVGAGRMGIRHIEAVQKMNELQLAGICDTNTATLVDAHQKLNVDQSHFFRNAEEMATKIKPQLAIIATTAPSHYDLTEMFAEHGAKYILCEKPMAVSLAECENMIAICQSKGVRLAINHQRRFMPRVILPKEIITRDSFGGLTSITQVGGNVGMAMNAIHTFELFEYLIGEAVSTVSAWFSDEIVPNPRGVAFEDRAGTVFARSESGRRLNLEIGADQGHGLQTTYAGRFGRLTVDEISGDCSLSIRQEKNRNDPTTRYACPAETQFFNIAAPDLIDATQKLLTEMLNAGDFPDGKSGRNAMAALVAAYLSHENSHKPTAVSEAFQHQARVFPWA